MAAVRQLLARPDPDAFLGWLRREGPEDHPGVFADVPAPELWPSFATNLGIEGDATAMYIHTRLDPDKVTITRLARGMPAGGDLEYADTITLTRALEGRREM